MFLANNERVPMTRREFDFPLKVKKRNAKIAMQLVRAWDLEKNPEKELQIFLKKKRLLPDQIYWELLRSVWITCGSLETADLFRELMTANRKYKYCFSTPEEIKILNDFPETFTVFRACNDENDGGLSWSTSKEYAERYKSMHNKKIIISKEVKKSDVFAYINRNNEDEIILL